MNRDEIESIFKDGRANLVRYWGNTVGVLPGHTPDNQAKGLAILDRYIETMRQLPDAPTAEQITGVLKDCVLEINALNQTANGSLFETDEREIIISMLLRISTAAGLDLSQFEYGDPTMDYRGF